MSNSRFQPRLEALRGVAASMVAWFHALTIVRVEGDLPLKIKSVLSMAASGTMGVTIFFVLSGYVLGLSLDASSSLRTADTVRFLARRALRIWPAMAVCVVACFLWVRFAFHPAVYTAASDDYYNHWRDGASLKALGLDLLLQQTYFNAVTWTLIVEMIGALLFVPLWWLSRRSWLASLALTVAWAIWFQSAPEPPRTAFVFMMLLGLQVGLIARPAGDHLRGRGIKLALGLTMAGCALAGHYLPDMAVWTWIVASLLAYLIVALIVASEGRVALRSLDHGATRFMGRISYSFYLWHYPVLWILATAGFAAIGAPVWLAWPNTMATALLIVSVLLTVPIAWASHRVIERPMMRLSRG